ncbi:hypothetical protein CSPHI_03185 [Corynebacterium sphenisci DSM 44792]|uniref:Uncharacterized protein n=1 Tax=Corynebacterium sphenisci DSM 44792 TaxID=1437874 RepID=A0A1L7CWJ1_9CORY|nr:hypothetical protein CSPHI_03185 [Corynebacterium sphenisci DSM 44792]
MAGIGRIDALFQTLSGGSGYFGIIGFCKEFVSMSVDFGDPLRSHRCLRFGVAVNELLQVIFRGEGRLVPGVLSLLLRCHPRRISDLFKSILGRGKIKPNGSVEVFLPVPAGPDAGSDFQIFQEYGIYVPD